MDAGQPEQGEIVHNSCSADIDCETTIIDNWVKSLVAVYFDTSAHTKLIDWPDFKNKPELWAKISSQRLTLSVASTQLGSIWWRSLLVTAFGYCCSLKKERVSASKRRGDQSYFEGVKGGKVYSGFKNRA